jgi:hypothetical protein
MKWFFLPFLGLFYAVGFAVLGYGLWASKNSLRAANWPTVPGKLTKAELAEKNDGESTTYEVQIAYTYNVAGKDFQGSRLAYGYSASSGSEVHGEILQKLKDAKEIDVRYDPDDPASSVLSYGIHRSIQFLLVFGTTWLAFIVGFTLLWYLAMRSDNVLIHNLSVR